MKSPIMLVLFIFLLIPKQVKSQLSKTNFTKFEIGELSEKSQNMGFVDMSSVFYYEGALTSGISNLLDIPLSRAKFVGNIPNKLIYYNSERTIPDVTNLKSQMLKILSYHYNFSVFDVQDTSEVWVLHKLENVKLAKHNPLTDDDGGHGVLRGNWEGIRQSLSVFCSIVDLNSNNIIIDETQDETIYNFPKTPVSLMSTDKFDEFNVFLKENYGVKFVKERRLEKLKLIKFEAITDNREDNLLIPNSKH